MEVTRGLQIFLKCLDVAKVSDMNTIEKIFRLRILFLVVLTIVLIVLIPISISIGVYNIGFIDLIKYIFFGGLDLEAKSILFLRFRRVLSSIVIGAILGSGGAAMQSILRNPMASPFTLGISWAAALGVAIALLTGIGGVASQWFLSFLNPYIIPLFAFSFALIQVAIVLLLVYRAGISEKALILASIAMSFLYQAVLYFIQYFFLNELQVALIVFWTFGDIGRVGWVELYILLSALSIVSIYYILKSYDFDLMLLGDDSATSSGINPKRFRLEAAVVTAFGASISTAFAGVIAFLCLVAPHIARLVIGSSHRYLIPASMAIGSILLVVADIVGRGITYVSIPVGITISFIGSPLLLYLLLRR
jgi:iron complex transport system permease protein